LPSFIEAGKSVKTFIGQVNAQGDWDLPESLHLKFWPPADVDQGEHWMCRCAQPPDPNGRAHWEMNVDVKAPPSSSTPLVTWA
jgi:hypothetical protein